MVERVSALEGQFSERHIGVPGASGVTLQVEQNLVLYQIAPWPDTLAEVGQRMAKALGLSQAPGPRLAASGADHSLLRVEPLKWWMIGGSLPTLPSNQGVVLDLSHSRTCVCIDGEYAATLLQRHMPLDLRESSFPLNAVASSAIHHVGVTLWRSTRGYELFIPRGFALSIWEIMTASAEQFGADIAPVPSPTSSSTPV